MCTAVYEAPTMAEPSPWSMGAMRSFQGRLRRREAMREAPAGSSWASRTAPMASPCQNSSNAHMVRNVVISGSR